MFFDFMNVKEKELAIGDSKLTYATFGKGKKPMVIIPGLSVRDVKGAGWGLAYMYRMFATDYRVYIFDRKEDIKEGCTVEDIAEDVAQAMGKLEISKAYVFGVSQGGMIAQYLALNHSELVVKMVLAVSLSQNNEVVIGAVNRWMSLFETKNYKGFVEDMFRSMYSETYLKKYNWMFPLLVKMSVPKNLERFSRLAKACLTCETYQRLGEIKCPVLILGGKKDLVTTGEACEEMAEKLGCQIYMYDDLGHAAYEEAKDFNQRIFHFFADETDK